VKQQCKGLQLVILPKPKAKYLVGRREQPIEEYSISAGLTQTQKHLRK